MTALRRVRHVASNASLRWQGRLEGPVGDAVIPWVVAAGMFSVLWSTAAAHAGHGDGAGRMGAPVQTVWLIWSGHPPVVTSGGGVHVLGEHFAVLWYPVALLTGILPTVGTLLALQAGVLALGVVPLWKLARVGASLRVGAATVLLVGYVLYPLVHQENLAAFSPGVVALPGLLWAAHAALVGQTRLLWVPVVMVLAARSDLGFAVAGLGASMWLVGRAAVGRSMVVVGLGWSALALMVFQPLVVGSSNVPLGSLAGFGDTPASALWGLVRNPGDVVAAVGGESSVALFAVLFGPVLFLPFLAPRLLVGAAPIGVLYLLGDPVSDPAAGQLAVPVTAFIFLATAFALSRLGRMGTQRVTVDRRLLVALMLAATVFFVVDSPTSPYRQPWSWGASPERVAQAGSVGVVDRNVRVAASAAVVDNLAERRVVTVVELGGRPGFTAVDDVEMVIVDEAGLREAGAVFRRGFADGLVSRGFNRLGGDANRRYADVGLVVWVRERPGP